MKRNLLIAAVLLVAACSDRVPPPSTPTPGPTAEPTRSPSPAPTAAPELPDFLAGADVRPLRLDYGVRLTNTGAFIIELGCTQCDGPTTGFARVYGRSFGLPQYDVLLTPEMLPLPPPNPDDQRYIAGFGFAPDASEMIAGVCVRGYCGGLGGPSPGAEVWLFRSLDGGITWEEYQRLPRPEIVIGWLGAGRVLTSHYDSAQGIPTFTAQPSGERQIPPRGAPEARPSVTAAGQVFWHDGNSRILYPDGKVYAETGQQGVTFGEPLPHEDGDILPLFWEGDGRYYLAQLNGNGDVRRAFTAESWFHPEAWVSPISNDRLFATVSVPDGTVVSGGQPQHAGVVPAITDLGSAIIQPIYEPFQEGPFLNGRNHIVAIEPGPVARVVNTDGCLNVRDAPSTSGNILDCLADGVLVRDSADVSQADGMTWAHVTTPAGVEGWVSTEYLGR